MEARLKDEDEYERRLEIGGIFDTAMRGVEQHRRWIGDGVVTGEDAGDVHGLVLQMTDDR